MANEVEIKFRIDNLPEIKRTLRALGFRQVTPRTHETNTLYDLPGQKLRRKGELLRLRQYGKQWTLTHKAKGATGRHKTRVERETRVEKGPELDAILQSLGYSPHFCYEKHRAEWSDRQGHVVLDETPIGVFGEIEGKPRWIDRVARALGIEESDYITDTYAGLFFVWKRRTKSSAREMTFRAVREGHRPR